MTSKTMAAGLVLAAVLAAPDAQAQTARGVAVEGLAGWAGYLDDATIEHTVAGASVRFPVLERLSVGPEVVYSNGPDPQRNIMLMGSLWFDLVPTTPQTRVVPYLVAGGGYQRQRDVVSFESGEGTFTAGGGVRVHVARWFYVGGDVRTGWEPHLRIAAPAGIAFPR